MTDEQDDLTLVYMWAFKKGEESAKSRIEALDKRNKELEALLKKLDDKFSSYKPYFGAEHSCHVNISFALIQEIRAALAGEKK